MKILVICQHYWPEPYPLTDICEELVRAGNEIDIITDVPNYPTGITYPEYMNRRNRIEKHNGVNIYRSFTIARRHNVVFRMLNYYSYAISSSHYINKLKKNYDVVFTNQTSPVMMTAAAFKYAKKHNLKVVMYCMDLWPASLAAGGLKKDSFIYKHFGKVSGKLYRKADRILITSQMFKKYLIEEHSVDEKVIEYLPQYATDIFSKEIDSIPKSNIDLMFAGNIGSAQSLTTVIEAAEILKNENIVWHIVGDGSELENLKNIVERKNLKNIIFHGRKPSEEMPEYYAMADAMLVTLTSDEFISMTLPGKVQTYMAAGKPIIAAADGEIPTSINSAKCGYCVKAEDSIGLANAVKEFIKCSNKKELGGNSRKYYEEHFSKDKFISKLISELESYSLK